MFGSRGDQSAAVAHAVGYIMEESKLEYLCSAHHGSVWLTRAAQAGRARAAAASRPLPRPGRCRVRPLSRLSPCPAAPRREACIDLPRPPSRERQKARGVPAALKGFSLPPHPRPV